VKRLYAVKVGVDPPESVFVPGVLPGQWPGLVQIDDKVPSPDPDGQFNVDQGDSPIPGQRLSCLSASGRTCQPLHDGTRRRCGHTLASRAEEPYYRRHQCEDRTEEHNLDLLGAGTE